MRIILVYNCVNKGILKLYMLEHALCFSVTAVVKLQSNKLNHPFSLYMGMD